MKLIETVHSKYIFQRRVRVLAEHIASCLPEDSKVLDVGCGDGLLDSLIAKQHKEQLEIEGIDVLLRKNIHIPIKRFDGAHIPYEDNSFDVVIFIDVLHHSEDPQILLREAKRIARLSIVLKDHTTDNMFAAPTLRFMDWIGNAHHGVALPYNYQSKLQWEKIFTGLGLTVASWKANLNLYPLPAHWLFDRNLHFIAKLDVNKNASVIPGNPSETEVGFGDLSSTFESS